MGARHAKETLTMYPLYSAISPSISRETPAWSDVILWPMITFSLSKALKDDDEDALPCPQGVR